jgi:signal transduction histidine kinase
VTTTFPAARPVRTKDLIAALGDAEDVDEAMTGLVGALRVLSGAQRVEWWAASDDARSFRRAAADGRQRGTWAAIPLGEAGAVVVAGVTDMPALLEALARIEPIVRRRRTNEQLALMSTELLRRYEALEDFAALVAHELKAGLAAASLARDPSAAIGDTIDLVDAILSAVRGGNATALASVAECLDDAARDLDVQVSVGTGLPTELSLPPTALRIVLRNLLANALAAGARHVRLSATRENGLWSIALEDDGVGLDAREKGAYERGTGVGLNLCRRIVERAGGALVLKPGLSGGTLATLMLG